MKSQRLFFVALLGVAACQHPVTPSAAKPIPVAAAVSPISISDVDKFRGAVLRCWVAPLGHNGSAPPIVTVRAELNPDGAVKSAQVINVDAARYSADPDYRAAAMGALRALTKCSPYTALPSDKYESWKEMEIRFDPATAY